jgi:2-keto-3-deoxy-L-rhamnonate aldolase RhmA
MEYNKILKKTHSNEVAIGLNLALNSPHLIEFFGSLGFDWVFIDCEHGSMTDSEAENMIRAAELYGMAPVVRVPGNEPHIILKMLDAGAKGIVVPHVDTVEDAI